MPLSVNITDSKNTFYLYDFIKQKQNRLNTNQPKVQIVVVKGPL